MRSIRERSLMKSARAIFKAYWHDDDPDNQEALKALEAEIDRIIGEDEPEVWIEQSEGVRSVEAGLMFRNHLRNQQRQRLREFLGVRE